MLTLIIVAFSFLLLILLLKKYPFLSLFNLARLKGKIGESFVAEILQEHLPKYKYMVIHNVTLPTDGGSTQIDHIVLSQYGIFVVETKNMKGWIFGNEKQEFWTQKNFRKSNKFQNPLRQNYKHIKTLEKILKTDGKIIFSVVVFVGDSIFKTPMPLNVVYGKEVVDYILSKQDKILTLEQVYIIKNAIENRMLERGSSTDMWHIKNVKKAKN